MVDDLMLHGILVSRSAGTGSLLYLPFVAAQEELPSRSTVEWGSSGGVHRSGFEAAEVGVAAMTESLQAAPEGVLHVVPGGLHSAQGPSREVDDLAELAEASVA
jgi:hypothetical protein